MTQQVSQSVSVAGTTPAALTPAATDTISESSFSTDGVYLRVITTGTATDVATVDAGPTALGNAGVAVPVSCPATGVRMILVPRAAVNPGTGMATITFSGARTGVTYEIYRA